MIQNHYITSPIYYVNAEPHIGHLYTSIICDTLVRIAKLQGAQVKFTTGTDEHGQKVAQMAEKQGKKPLQFATEISQKFRDMSDNLQLCHTDFIRTTEERHAKNVHKVWQKLQEKNYIYLGKYSGFYCTREEAFFQENELINGKTPDGGEVVWTEEESYFFRLSAFEKPLLDFYDQNPNFILPKNRLNEVKNFVKSGLKDISISRTSVEWGIQVPNNPQHTIYVWIDALTNYLTSLGYDDENNADFEQFWLKGKKIHILGKDILRFHAVFWPAILLALELPLPDQLIVHGWWLRDGQKISKSVGNVISAQELIADYDHDVLRYFLLREMALGEDGNFTADSFQARVNSELAGNLGNLVMRTFAMSKKSCDLQCTLLNDLKNDSEFSVFLTNLQQAAQDAQQEIFSFNFHHALQKILQISSTANAILNQFEPWKIKDNPEKLQKVLTSVLFHIKIVAILLQPFLPQKSALILKCFGCDNSINFAEIEKIFQQDLKISQMPEKLFEKIE